MKTLPTIFVRLLLRVSRIESWVDSYEQLIRLGSLRVQLGDSDKALRNFKTAIQVEPTRTDAYVLRSELYLDLDRGDLAMRDIETALGLDSTDEAIYKVQGDVLRTIARYQDAVQAYALAIELCSNYSEAYVGRGYAYAELCRWEESLKDLKLGKSLTQRPNLQLDEWISIAEQNLEREGDSEVREPIAERRKRTSFDAFA